MTQTKSIALLVCGALPPGLGDYHKVFSTFLQNSLPNATIQFILDPYDVVHKMVYPPDDKIDSYDGILITGSASSAYENIEWINKLVAYIAKIAETKPRIKLLGICYGHQIIARALGAQCVRNNGVWEVGPTPLQLTDTGKQIFGVDSLSIQEMHQDHIPQLPDGVHLLGSTGVSYNQGMVRYAKSADVQTSPSVEDIQIFTVQGHPEFTETLVTGIIDARKAAGIFSAEVAEDAMRRRYAQNDGVSVVGRAIWKILGVSNESS